jgi:ankyrin repeat protein
MEFFMVKSLFFLSILLFSGISHVSAMDFHQPFFVMDVLDDEGETPLTRAVMANNLPEIVTLLDSGANINGRNHLGFTPLMVAADDANLEIAQYLFSRGANLEDRCMPEVETYGGFGLVSLASGGGSIEEPSIEETLEVNQERRVSFLRWLVDGHGLSIDSLEDQRRPLSLAAELGLDQVVRFFIGCGVDVGASDRDGAEMTPLQCALNNDFDSSLLVVRVLIENGAHVDAALFAEACYSNNPRLLRLLLECGASPLDRDSSGNLTCSALTAALSIRRIQSLEVVLQFFIDAGVRSINDSDAQYSIDEIDHLLAQQLSVGLRVESFELTNGSNPVAVRGWFRDINIMLVKFLKGCSRFKRFLPQTVRVIWQMPNHLVWNEVFGQLPIFQMRDSQPQVARVLNPRLRMQAIFIRAMKRTIENLFKR